MSVLPTGDPDVESYKLLRRRADLLTTRFDAVAAAYNALVGRGPATRFP